MRTTSARELNACFFAYKLRSGGLDAWQVHGMGAWWEEGCGWEVDGRWMVAPLPLHLRDALRAAERHVVHLLVTGLHIRSGLGQNLPRLAQVRLCVRTGMAWPSLLRWSSILVEAGSSASGSPSRAASVGFAFTCIGARLRVQGRGRGARPQDDAGSLLKWTNRCCHQIAAKTIQEKQAGGSNARTLQSSAV